MDFLNRVNSTVSGARNSFDSATGLYNSVNNAFRYPQAQTQAQPQPYIYHPHTGAMTGMPSNMLYRENFMDSTSTMNYWWIIILLLILLFGLLYYQSRPNWM